MRPRPTLHRLLFATAALLPIAPVASAQTVWTGDDTTYTHVGGSDISQPENRDELTENVALTRGITGGLINSFGESFFNSGASPADTLWASDLNNPGEVIDAANFANLSFIPWLNALGGSQSQGAFIPNRPTVVHLVTDDIYLNLEFSSWEPFSGGGFSYTRSTPGSAAIPGDYDGDDDVDADDFLRWREQFDLVGEDLDADGNGDGRVDAADYTVWRDAFASSGDISTAVPEPAGWLLSALLLAASSLSRRLPIF